MAISRVVLPVLDLEQNDNPLRKKVLKGAKHFTVQQISADSQSENSIVFTVNPPSQNTVIDRRFDLQVPYRVTLAGSVSNGFVYGVLADNRTKFINSNILIPDIMTLNSSAVTAETLNNSNVSGSSFPLMLINNFALRQFPLASIMNSVDLVINGTHISAEPKKYVHAVAKYTSASYREWALGAVAHHPDNYFGSYSQWAIQNKTANNQFNNTWSGVVNPLNIAKNGGANGETPRGYYTVLQAQTTSDDKNTVAFTAINEDGSSGSNTFDLLLREPLFISPLSLHYGEGITNINEIQVTVNWDTNNNKRRLLSMFSLGSDADADTMIKRTSANSVINPTADISVAYPGTGTSARLLVRFYTAQDDIRIPNEIVLPYYQPRVFTTAVTGTLAAGHADSVLSYNGNNRRLDQIPQCVYLFARVKDSNLTISDPDAFMALTNVKIQFGNQAGILSGLNPYQLFKLAVENGADYESFAPGYYQEGVVLKLEFGKDIPLANNESPGTRGDYSIQVSCDLSSAFNGGTIQDIDFREVYVNLGQVIVSPNECRVQTGLLDIKDNIEAEDMGDHYDTRHATNLMGAGLFSSIGKFIGKAASGIARAAPHAMKALPHLADAANAAANVAQAAQAGGSQTGGSFVGGSDTGGSAVGGSMVGGRRMRSRRF